LEDFLQDPGKRLNALPLFGHWLRQGLFERCNLGAAVRYGWIDRGVNRKDRMNRTIMALVVA
jgi:hypothetical protein